VQPCAADGEQRQSDRRSRETFEWKRPRRHEAFEEAYLTCGVLGVAGQVEVVYPAEQPNWVRVAHRHNVEAGGIERAGQLPLRVPAVMAERGVVRSVQRLNRRYEDQDLSARIGDDVAEQPQRAHVVLDVLEHVDADDRIEPLLLQLVGVALFEMADPDSEAGMRAELFACPRRAVEVRLDAGHLLGHVEELAGHRADPAAHFEHARANVRPHKAEDMGLIPARLAHRLEVVGGVLLLRLCESAVDVHARE
jgi:hypothetical protein